MKKNYYTVFVITIIVLGFVLSFDSTVISNSAAPPASRTGSPGDGGNNCSGCHGGLAVSNQVGWINSNIPGTGYIPGDTYTITISGTHTGVSKFGFECVVEDALANSVGTLVATDVVKTQLIGNSKYIAHTTAGLTPVGSTNTWSFDWIAPITGTGTVTFFVALNAANGNGGFGGDKIYTSSLTIQENTNVPIGLMDYFGQTKVLSIYPNPVTEYANITFGIELESDANITVYNNAGVVVLMKTNGFEEHSKLDLKNLSSGTYFVALNNGGQRVTRKILVQ